MVAILSADDLAPFAVIDEAKAQAMVTDALALAARVAPCITSDEFTEVAAARAILRGAVLRWHEAGSGAFQSQTAGPFAVTHDTRQARRSMFWPSEIAELQALCGSGQGSVYTVSLAGP